MIKNPRVKKIKGGLQVGDKVPLQDKNYNPGNVGNYHEKVLKSDGINVEESGIDLPDLECELKTRNEDATSRITITRMNLEEIKKTPYSQSKVKQSIKNLDVTRYKDGVVISRTIHHWDKDPIIDNEFEKSYEYLRKEILNGNCNSYIGGPKNSGFCWEETSTSGTYAWRITSSKFKRFEKITKIMSSGLFEII